MPEVQAMAKEQIVLKINEGFNAKDESEQIKAAPDFILAFISYNMKSALDEAFYQYSREFVIPKEDLWRRYLDTTM